MKHMVLLVLKYAIFAITTLFSVIMLAMAFVLTGASAAAQALFLGVIFLHLGFEMSEPRSMNSQFVRCERLFVSGFAWMSASLIAALVLRNSVLIGSLWIFTACIYVLQIGVLHGYRPRGTQTDSYPIDPACAARNRAIAGAIADAIATGKSFEPKGDALDSSTAERVKSLVGYGPGMYRQIQAQSADEQIAISALRWICLSTLDFRLAMHNGVKLQLNPIDQGNALPMITVTVGHDTEGLKASPVEIGEIIAHRAWLCIKTEDGPRLRSTFMRTVWQPDQPVYGKIEDEFLTAQGGGVHATKDKDFALHYALLNLDYSIAIVVGRVKLYGTVIEHERGYRAEYAAVHALDTIVLERGGGFVTSEDDPLLNLLRQEYGVTDRVEP